MKKYEVIVFNTKTEEIEKEFEFESLKNAITIYELEKEKINSYSPIAVQLIEDGCKVIYSYNC